MHKKTLLLIIMLAAVTTVLIFLALNNQGVNKVKVELPAPAKKVVAKTARVMFSPQNIDLSTGSASGASTVDLIIETGESDIVGVQTELIFDPKALTNVKLTPATDATGFFGNTGVVLFNDVNAQTGRISYAAAINAGQQPKKGLGKIATLTFQKAYNAPASTSIAFLEKTLVTKLGETESILKEALPLSITFTKSQASIQEVPAIRAPR